MTCRLNFTKRAGMGVGSSEAYQASASMTEPPPGCKQEGRKRLVRASLDGRAALSLAACGRVVPLRPNLRRAWGLGHSSREVAWLLDPPAFTGRRLWWRPGRVIRAVRS